MTLTQRIELNRRKQLRYKKYTNLLRRIRLKIFDYEDEGKSEQASRIITKCKVILEPYWQAHHDTVWAAKMQNYHM